jgi:hypothetical protein
MPSATGPEVSLTLDPALDAALTWDPLQSRRETPREFTGADAMTITSVRGGGCSQAGDVGVACGGITNVWVHGAKSPDVNGDCRVMEDDLAYVQPQIGTSDFCADLDGSGLVDDADVAVVEATLGDLCSSLAALPDSPGGRPDGEPGSGRKASHGLGVTLVPNPCRDAVAIRCDLPFAGSAGVRIVDVGGRLVRDLQAGHLSPGPHTFVWDTRDTGDRRVPAGIYFADLHAGEQAARRCLLVVR